MVDVLVRIAPAEEQKMGAFLGVPGNGPRTRVHRAGAQPDRFDEAPVVLVGKGLTFDMGGIRSSLRPACRR